MGVNPTDIKMEIFNFFSSKFNERWPVRPKLISPLFKKLAPEHRCHLESPISIDEIKKAIWGCGS